MDGSMKFFIGHGKALFDRFNQIRRAHDFFVQQLETGCSTNQAELDKGDHP